MRNVFWCLGVHASGSTWIYNVAREVAKIRFAAQPIVSDFLGYKSPLNIASDNTVYIFKTHGLSDTNESSLGDASSAVIISLRDPRDAVASLMLYHEYTFTRALLEVEQAVRTCKRMQADRRTLLLRYESGFAEDKQTVTKIATALGSEISAEEIDRIFNQLKRESVNKLIADLEVDPKAQAAGSDVYHAETQWHKFHANRTGEIGKWRRTLTAAQIASIEWRLRDWMAVCDYELTQSFDALTRIVRHGVDLLTSKERL